MKGSDMASSLGPSWVDPKQSDDEVDAEEWSHVVVGLTATLTATDRTGTQVA